MNIPCEQRGIFKRRRETRMGEGWAVQVTTGGELLGEKVCETRAQQKGEFIRNQWPIRALKTRDAKAWRRSRTGAIHSCQRRWSEGLGVGVDAGCWGPSGSQSWRCREKRGAGEHRTVPSKPMQPGEELGRNFASTCLEIESAKSNEGEIPRCER